MKRITCYNCGSLGSISNNTRPGTYISCPTCKGTGYVTTTTTTQTAPSTEKKMFAAFQTAPSTEKLVS